MTLIKFLSPLLLLVLTSSHTSTAVNYLKPYSPTTVDSPRVLPQERALRVTQRSLTNDEIVKMIAAGLAETTIIQVIHTGPTDFDTSPEALIKLKQSGASAIIIEAMLRPAPAKTGAPANTVADKGVFVRSVNEWERIEEVSSIEVRSVGHISNAVTFGIKEQRVICVFRGEKAERQLNERWPVFRVAGLGASARDVYIVAMRLNPDRRDLEMGRQGLIKKMSFGFRKRDVRDVEVKRLGADLLEVIPRQDLEPGEYIMVLGGVGVFPNTAAGPDGTTGFDFGIGPH